MFPKSLNVPLLFELWPTDMTRREIADRLGLSLGQLASASRKYALGRRHRRSHDSKASAPDPTPEEIAERSAWVRARWTPEEEARRRGASPDRWRPPGFVFSPKTTSFDRCDFSC